MDLEIFNRRYENIKEYDIIKMKNHDLDITISMSWIFNQK